MAVSSRSGRQAALLIAPAYLWLALAVFLPLAAMFYFSFLTAPPFGRAPSEWTLKHYSAFFERDFYRTLTWRSLWLGVHVTLISALIGLPTAIVLARAVPDRWREAIMLLVVLPFWTNALVRVFSWTMVLRGDGLIDRALATLPGAPSLDILYSYPAIVIGLVHAYLPYMILTCYLSVSAIDATLYDAARSLGANRLTVFRRIILPLAMPGLATGGILIFVPVVGSFMEPRILGGAQGQMLGNVIEDQFVASFNWPLGAALSFILLGFVLVILAASAPILRGQVLTGVK